MSSMLSNNLHIVIRQLTAAILLLTSGILSAQKTDLLILKNGDQLTGEVKVLDLEILQYKTSTMSTVKVKWHHVSNIIAPDKYFEITLSDQTIIYGALDSINIPNAIRARGSAGTYNIPTDNIVKIQQVKKIIWSRFSGNLSTGFSYTKASEVRQFNFAGGLSYTDELYYSHFDVNSIRTTQPDRPNTTKQDITWAINRTLSGRHFSTAFVAAQENTELGIALRTIGGLGYGYEFIRSSIARVRSTAGMTANNERRIEDNASRNNVEGFVSADARIFKYTDPEIYLTATGTWYPSFTIAGRHRAETDINLRFELLNNLFFELKFYVNYDNKPVSETAASNDYGIVSGIAYTFGL